ncbi:methyltransferase domain-containing protein [Hymenobacter rubripertinctus]|uniref:Methyltransferase domain-containing protein n=1 Tax=Hymenobacter rubripertinctus TaxID=2029981 RepID=A0A418R474_9BACT|nr:methyltransferase domain-containing protein [Hymenobacter rubripertinctus]RIY12149.1 methyltransferase domain-containing protein [Hymenobacter rubripertinctus]
MPPDLPFDAAYWQQRYVSGQTGWDAGAITPPLREYFAQLGKPDARRILIPGAGNAYEAEYLHAAGWPNVWVADLAPAPLEALARRVPDFPAEHLLRTDFFALQPTPAFDLLVEQTFFCALDPALRPAYARQAAGLLRPGGTLMGLLFDTEFEKAGPPFGGSRPEYEAYFAPYFDVQHFETATNSLKPRQGKELFICLKRKPLIDGDE